MNFKDRTPEQWQESRKRGIETAKKNREERQKLIDKKSQDSLDLVFGIAEKRAELKKLEKEIEVQTVALELTKTNLYTEEKIVESSLPFNNNDQSGVYFLINDMKIVYVGQSVNVYSRIPQHVDKRFDRYAIVRCERNLLDLMESLYIHVIRPKLNGNYGDDKAAPISFPGLLDIAAGQMKEAA